MKERNRSNAAADDLNYPSQYQEVLGAKLHFIEQGSGNPILFLHGVPSSAYVWRNVLPFLAPLGRCLAVDLIGMGKSDKPDIDYTIEDHLRYLEAFIAAKNLKNITLVMHGWGSVLGLDYASRHPDNCRALVLYESFLKPIVGNDLSLAFEEQQALLKLGSESGQALAEMILTQSRMQNFTPKQLENYTQAFANEKDKVFAEKALRTYLRELPSGDGKSQTDHRLAQHAQFLMQSPLPKLLLYSLPGFVTTMGTLMWAKDKLPNLELCDLGEEFHFAQESCPELMGELISVWLQAQEQQR